MSEQGAGTIAAVVVTYNRLNLLKECVTAVRSQSRRPDEIIVVNNGSTDGTVGWLAAQDDLVVINQENVGSSGAYHAGFETAYDRGNDWIWSMDDDGKPTGDVLRNFEKAVTTDLKAYKVLNSKVYHCESKQEPGISLESIAELRKETKYEFSGAKMFNGTFIHRDAIKEVGNVNRDLFMWGDESNFLIRCNRKYGTVPVILDCLHYHPYTSVTSGTAGSVKKYYVIRNSVYNKLVLSRFGILGVTYIILRQFRLVLKRQVSMRIYFLAVFMGLTRQMGKNHERFNLS